jgi:hypothetical protein
MPTPKCVGSSCSRGCTTVGDAGAGRRLQELTKERTVGSADVNSQGNFAGVDAVRRIIRPQGGQARHGASELRRHLRVSLHVFKHG